MLGGKGERAVYRPGPETASGLAGTRRTRSGLQIQIADISILHPRLLPLNYRNGVNWRKRPCISFSRVQLTTDAYKVTGAQIA